MKSKAGEGSEAYAYQQDQAQSPPPAQTSRSTEDPYQNPKADIQSPAGAIEPDSRKKIRGNKKSGKVAKDKEAKGRKKEEDEKQGKGLYGEGDRRGTIW